MKEPKELYSRNEKKKKIKQTNPKMNMKEPKELYSRNLHTHCSATWLSWIISFYGNVDYRGRNKMRNLGLVFQHFKLCSVIIHFRGNASQRPNIGIGRLLRKSWESKYNKTIRMENKHRKCYGLRHISLKLSLTSFFLPFSLLSQERKKTFKCNLVSLRKNVYCKKKFCCIILYQLLQWL